MPEQTYYEREQYRTRTLISLTQASMENRYDIRGIFRINEDGPAGKKSRCEEKNIKDSRLDDLVGGVFFVCPKGDKTNGEVFLEISTRDSTIRVKNYKHKGEAAFLLNRYEEADCKFHILDS